MAGGENTIKLALLLKDTKLPAWQYEMLKRLSAITHINIVLVLTGGNSKQTYPEKLLAVLNGMSGWLEKKLLGWNGNSRRRLDATELLKNIPQLGNNMPATRQVFMAHKPDLVLDLLGTADKAAYLYQTSTGQLWHYFYDETLTSTPAHAGIRSYGRGRDSIASGLLSRDEHGNQYYLFRTTNSIDRPLFSQNIDQLLWKLVDFIPALLQQVSKPEALLQQTKRLHQHHTHQVDNSLLNDTSPAHQHKITLHAIWHLAWRDFMNFSSKAVNKLCWPRTHEQWVLLLEQSELNQPRDIHTLTAFERLVPPPDRFWADPFLIHEAGRDYIFLEELVYTQGKGRLVCIELDADGTPGKPVVVLEKPYHLSYPFLFRYQDELYMIPESAENRTLDLYRCEQFPQQWVKVKTIMADVEAYDATLFADEQGEWWMFVCMRQHQYASTNELLYLFSAPNPLTDDWEPHPCNPVVSDAATARPAGNLLYLNSRLYRPSQNCVPSYGRGLNLNEVITLNKQEYREQTSSQLIPSDQSGLDGIHTLNCLNDRVVSDGVLLRKKY